MIILALLAAAPLAWAAESPFPLRRAYSHNDYEQARPLDDALDRGFCAVEADVHLVRGELLIGHMSGKPGATLQKLYLDPLLKRVRENGGRVYPGGPEFTLLIDVKTDGTRTYKALREVLARYSEMLTTFTPDEIRPGAVTVYVSGNRDAKLMRAEPLRYAAVDGRLENLDSDEKTLYPLISDNWRNHFEWRRGPMDRFERARLENILNRAHAKGRKVRFWAIPDYEESWSLMLASGVDFINTDRLEGLSRFLLAHRDGRDFVDLSARMKRLVLTTAEQAGFNPADLAAPPAMGR